MARNYGLSVEQGLLVGDVYRGSGASAAGLKGSVIRESIWGGAVLQQIGDVILSVDGKKVASTDDLQNALQDKKPGQMVEVEVLRGGQTVTVSLRLSERPAELR
jgi:S1-C subfamily serine protease